MTPLVGNQRARQDLLEVFSEFDLMANVNKMIATRIFPVLTLPLAHGTYPWLPIKELLKRRAEAAATAQGYAGQRAPGGGYARSSISFGQRPYNTIEHGFEGEVDENEAHVYASHFEHESTVAVKTYHDLMLERELRTAGVAFSTTTFVPNAGIGHSQDAGTYRKDLSVGSAVPWSDAANSNPITDVWVAKKKVWMRTAHYPTDMAINEETFRHLRLSDQIRQEWIAQGAGSRGHQEMLGVFDHSLEATGHIDAARSAIASVLELEHIHVGSAVIDGNPDINADFQSQHAWGNSALVFKRVEGNGAASLKTVGLGHTFLWKNDNAGSNTLVRNNRIGAVAEGVHVEEYWSDENRMWYIRSRHQDSTHLKYVDAGELITDVI